MTNTRLTIGAVLILGAGACTAGSGDEASLPEGCDLFVEPSDDDQTALAEAFVDAEDGNTICLAAGTFKPTRQLTLTATDVTLRGEGIDDTTLDFTDQQTGGNGIIVKGNGTTLEAFQVKNTPGDGIRGDQLENITFDHVRVAWDAMHSLANGAYGLYPVQCTGVRIQHSEVIGARDAGIYVGQSHDIVVEDSIAHDNVAGIEIENSTDAQVRRNQAFNNVGGILVFNLPGLDVKDGQRTNVYENDIHDNNVGPNWGDPGTTVGKVPPGMGMLVLAADNNEIHNNTFTNNNSVGIAIIAYSEPLVNNGIFEAPNDPAYDTWSEGNYVHDNTFTNNGTAPDPLVQLLIGNMPTSFDVIFDGCEDPAKDNADGSLTNCLGEPAATFVDADVCATASMPSTDTGPVACMHTALPTD